MIELVTLAEVKAHVRMDHALDDADLTLKIQGASAVILAYLKDGALTFTDSSGNFLDFDSQGEPVVPPQVKLATLALVGILARDRDGQEMEKWQHGFLPYPVTSLIYMMRDPAVA